MDCNKIKHILFLPYQAKNGSCAFLSHGSKIKKTKITPDQLCPQEGACPHGTLIHKAQSKLRKSIQNRRSDADKKILCVQKENKFQRIMGQTVDANCTITSPNIKWTESKKNITLHSSLLILRPPFFTRNPTPSILHSASFNFQPYSKGWSLTSKKPFLSILKKIVIVFFELEFRGATRPLF